MMREGLLPFMKENLQKGLPEDSSLQESLRSERRIYYELQSIDRKVNIDQNRVPHIHEEVEINF